MENENQKKAIEHFKGPALVLAGPGSGKTFVLTRRIKNLIVEKKVNPNNILVITFTRNAAKEMKERFIKLCDEENIKLKNVPSFGTFHSIFFEMLRDNFGYSADSLIKENEERLFLSNVLENEKDLKITRDLLDLILKDIKEYKLSIEKGEKFNPKSLTKKKFEKIYENYKEYLFNRKKLDFPDMINILKEQLKKNTDILEYYQDKYEFILIDEFQDINNEQYEIVKMLSKTHNIFVVGDDDQSIYKFRGSKPRVMKDFLKDYKNTKTYILNQNYRSSDIIVKFSKAIIDNNKERFKKDLVSENKEKGKIIIKKFDDSNDESEFIIKEIKKRLKEGYNLNDIAILYRTNLISLAISMNLKKENIKFRLKDKSYSALENFAIKDILSYLKIFSGNETSNDYLNISNKPLRYISRDSIKFENFDIKSLFNYYKNKGFMLKYIEKLDMDIKKGKKLLPTLAIQYIRHNIGYEEYLIDYCKEKNISYEDIKELLDELEDEAVKFKDKKLFLKYLDDISNIEEDKDEDCIKLMTFHGSKGLEFKIVIIIDANEMIIPHKKSIKEKDIETERRLFYVATTRAKKLLYLLFTTKRYAKTYEPSRFIKEGLEEA